MRGTVRDMLTGAILGLIGLGLILWPDAVLAAGRETLTLCGNVIIPSLFPFFVLSSLMVNSGLAQRLGKLLQGVMAPLFRLNGNCAAALVLGLIGGYPVGAKTAAELYQKGLCSKGEAERMLAFCNNSGPAFLLGVVGTGVFGSTKIGLFLCAVHGFTALLIGLLFRFYPAESSKVKFMSTREMLPSPAKMFTDSVKNSFSSLLHVCAFILFFGVVLALLECCGVLEFLAGERLWLRRLLGGMLELSNGVAALTGTSPLTSIPLAAFLLGWGGVSVLCQTMSVIQSSGLSLRTCVIGKLLHGSLSALLSALVLRLFPGAAEAAALAAQQISSPVLPSWGSILLFSLTTALVMWALICQLPKNKGGNRRKSRL